MSTNNASHALIPQKTTLGAEILTQRESGLSYTMRRLLLLANGERNVGELINMLPGQNVVAELNMLVDRGLLDIATERRAETPSAPAPEMPEQWMTASNFMMARARESLGVMAAGVINDLERVQDPEAARQAMSRWYRALRDSRGGRMQADTLRVQVAQMLRGSGLTGSPASR